LKVTTLMAVLVGFRLQADTSCSVGVAVAPGSGGAVSNASVSTGEAVGAVTGANRKFLHATENPWSGHPGLLTLSATETPDQVKRCSSCSLRTHNADEPPRQENR
jgi:hypothetical protein